MESKNNRLVLLRHGESQWNLENRFTGWTDVEMTENGIKEAINAGKMLEQKSFKFDLVYTSVLKRAIHTMELCLDSMNSNNVRIKYDWRLNERHYGALQGFNKSETAKKYGDRQVLLWRRSYDIRPPLLNLNDERHPRFDTKYKNLEEYKLPRGECLKDTIIRVIPFWDNIILPKLNSGGKILIVAHGNSLRAIVKILNQISDKDIIELNIPTGIPLIFEFDKKLNPIKNYYLGDQNELHKKLTNIVAQGKSN